MSRAPDRVRALIDALLAEQDTIDNTGRRCLRRLWTESLRPYRRRMILAVLAIIAYGSVGYGFALASRYLIDHALLPSGSATGATMPARFRAVFIYAAINLALWTAHVIAYYTYGRAVHTTAQSLVVALRKRLHEKLQVLHIGFYDETPTGKIMSRVLDDIAVVQASITSYLPTLVLSCAQLIAGIGVLTYLSWQLALLFTITLPVYAATYMIFRPLIRHASQALSRQNSKMYSLAAERISGVRVVKAFGKEAPETKRLARLIHDFVRMALRLLLYNQGMVLAAGLISATATTGLILATALRFRAGAMSFGSVVAFVAASASVFGPIANLSAFGAQLQSVIISLSRVFGLLDVGENVTPGPRQLHHELNTGAVTFENVRFTYSRADAPVLQDVSFALEPGQHVALMGPSGSGKSTVFAMLLRFYDPDSGIVRLGGIDLRETDPRSVRRLVCMVQQEPTLFSGTITENIMYGHLEATPSAVKGAARQAELHDAIMSLPAKYETEVGEGGVNLSGGQKQRVALATALLTDPAILLLDDTTSALDPETESKIQTTLARVLSGRTSLVITQRISTARRCDRIFIMDNGRLDDAGTHDELLQTNAFYQAIHEKQD